jgi:MFS transporter, PAT family, beta-lactamase induction signal transducer AmpG
MILPRLAGEANAKREKVFLPPSPPLEFSPLKPMPPTSAASRSPWAWIPTLYFAEGLPYALVMSVSAVLYKNLGESNAKITFWISLLGWPWILKPLWSPAVDILRTRRQWIWATQLLSGALLATVALAVPAPHCFQWTLALFALLAFNSATHDVAADGFYIVALPERGQALFSGVRNTFYRVANIAAQGLLVVLVGRWHRQTGSYATAWAAAFALTAGILLALGIYHRWVLPRPPDDAPCRENSGRRFFADFAETFAAFFRKPKIAVLLAFILLYRFGEAQLLAVAKLFLLDGRAQGGLALTDAEFGWIYGTVGVIALLAGGLLGGFLVSRHGLKSWLWPMLLAIHLPDAVFIWLAYAQPQNLAVVGAGVAVEQFGYGFGFTAFMLYLIYIARGRHATAHYALGTGFMALGLNLPMAWSGKLQEFLGYPHFFVWVILATIPSFLVATKIPLDPEFGKRGSTRTAKS